MIKNVDTEVLESIKYNEVFLDTNLKLINGKDIPRIHEKIVDGVFNVEFDSDLSSVKEFDKNEINEWLL